MLGPNLGNGLATVAALGVHFKLNENHMDNVVLSLVHFYVSTNDCEAKICLHGYVGKWPQL